MFWQISAFTFLIKQKNVKLFFYIWLDFKKVTANDNKERGVVVTRNTRPPPPPPPPLTDLLRPFPCFAVRSSSAHEGKLIIFERFHCSLTKTIELNWKLVKLIGKFEICSIEPTFVKLAPVSHFSDLLHNISKTSTVTHLFFFRSFHWYINDLRYILEKTTKIYWQKLEI